MKPDGYVPDILIRGLSVKLRRGQGPKKLWIPYVLLYSVVIFSKSRTIYFPRRGQCSSWIFCTIYVCIPNVSLVVETASPLHACTVTVPCAHLLFSPLKSFSTSIVSPFHTL